jgi:hypothetical protein
VVRNKNSPWVGEHDGFSLHAGVSFGALDRKGREKLVRYRTRPPIALARLSVLSDGSIAYRCKWTARGGKTHRFCRAAHTRRVPERGAGILGPLIQPERGPVYIDTATLIYRIERVEPYLSTSAPLWDALGRGTHGLVTRSLGIWGLSTAVRKEMTNSRSSGAANLAIKGAQRDRVCWKTGRNQ